MLRLRWWRICCYEEGVYEDAMSTASTQVGRCGEGDEPVRRRVPMNHQLHIFVLNRNKVAHSIPRRRTSSDSGSRMAGERKGAKLKRRRMAELEAAFSN